ncbi:unnamed protein product [Dicrocoelium dendriticum]|nr:unnamed protein product [Dicrocoelium dendriticum]
MASRSKPKKMNRRQQKYKEVVHHRVSSKTPPVQYTRRLKTKKQKKLKQIGSIIRKPGTFDRPPLDDSQHIPASFIEMLQRKALKGKRMRSVVRSGVGDTVGMKKPVVINKMPKQGKHESDAHYIGRVHREVEEELAKVQFAKAQKTRLILDKPVKTKKKVKSIKRLRERKKAKQARALEKRSTGYEHLKDEIRFNEVVTAPPTNLTKPKKVGSTTLRGGAHPIDKILQTW